MHVFFTISKNQAQTENFDTHRLFNIIFNYLTVFIKKFLFVIRFLGAHIVDSPVNHIRNHCGKYRTVNKKHSIWGATYVETWTYSLDVNSGSGSPSRILISLVTLFCMKDHPSSNVIIFQESVASSLESNSVKKLRI